ncbi:MAG: NAD-dependent epimerase/dehydratase family protein, partial [Bacteroidia bacterium]|nr:NAD-dependent epimerase/dehydratase family protein [Bacteroidia bacterium]MDW8134795.1 NAD-dependent epimerase/dehydratase family protein [Bacteroidia bacterium]
TSLSSPIEDAKTNILGTLHLLEAVAPQKSWVIFASTGGAIYGEKRDTPFSEEDIPQPDSPYGIAKLSCEWYLHYFSKVRGVPFTILRLANVYGPRQNPFGEAGVVAIFSHRFLTGQQAYIYGDGEQTRDFIYIDDVVKAFLQVLRTPHTTQGRLFNIGTARYTSINQLYQMICMLTSTNTPPQYLPPKLGELKHNALNWKRFYEATGWQPQTPLEEGLRKTVAAFKKLYATS